MLLEQREDSEQRIRRVVRPPSVAWAARFDRTSRVVVCCFPQSRQQKEGSYGTCREVPTRFFACSASERRLAASRCGNSFTAHIVHLPLAAASGSPTVPHAPRDLESRSLTMAIFTLWL